MAAGTVTGTPRSLAAAAGACRPLVQAPVAHRPAAAACRRARHSRQLSQAAAVEAPPAPAQTMEWFQRTIALPSKARGCHVVTRELLKELPELSKVECGMCNFFIQHTSASLTINENASSDVPLDLADALDRIAPEGRHYRHLDEGLDDMPAHVKSSLMGPSLSIPISQGRLALGTWQGIYLGEHRDHGGSRKVVVTVQGKLRADGKEYGKSYRGW